MLTALWEEIIRMSDFLLLSMQTELFSFMYILLLLIIGYYIIHPFIRLLIALEWGTFLTFLLTIILVFMIVSQSISNQEIQYFVYAIMVFSIFICFKKGVLLLKRSTKQ